MFTENRGITITILLVVIISIGALIAVVYSLIQALQQVEFGSFSSLVPDRQIKVLPRENNYNFAIPTAEIIEDEPEVKGLNYNFNFAIPEKKALPEMESIKIPAINYSSPIIESENAVEAVEQGAWHYPSNHPLEGEAIFLCHRRYFSQRDSKSCWYLDRVKKGDSLFINFSDGSQKYYKVTSVNVTDAENLSIYNASTEEMIKLISCSISNGKIGGDSHRITVTADAVK